MVNIATSPYVIIFRCLVPECEDPTNTSYHRPWFSENGDSITYRCIRSKPLNKTIFNEKCPRNMFHEYEIDLCTQWVFDKSERTMMSDVSD